MKDIVGNPVAIGDQVATDVTYRKSSSLRIGTLTEVDGLYVKVSYELAPNRWSANPDRPVKKSVWRVPAGVVKVASA